jgi:hypothetical protein
MAQKGCFTSDVGDLFVYFLTTQPRDDNLGGKKVKKAIPATGRGGL